MMHVVDKRTLTKKLKDAERPVLILFTVSGCCPCQFVEPILDDISSEYENVIDFYKYPIDADHWEEDELIQQLEAGPFPTVVSVKDGAVYEKAVGDHPQRFYFELLRRLAPEH